MQRKVGELELLTAAWLYAETLKSPKEIADLLGVHESVVSRLLSKARGAGYLGLRPRFAAEKFTQEKLEQIRLRANSNGLEVRLGEALRPMGIKPPLIRVFSSGSQVTTTTGWGVRLKAFSAAAAPHIWDLLRESTVVGVSWGETIATLVRAIGAYPGPKLQGLKEVIPLCGEPLDETVTMHGSSSLAARLSEALTGDTMHKLSLNSVPAFLPRLGFPNELEVMGAYLSRVRSFVQIFGKYPNAGQARGKCLVSEMDTFLSSVSVDGNPLGFMAGNLTKTTGTSREELRDLVLGDVGGALLPVASKKSHPTLQQLSYSRWTGVALEDIRRCGTKGKTIIIAIGSNKAQTVFAALFSKDLRVTNLVCDQDLGDAMERILRATGLEGQAL